MGKSPACAPHDDLIVRLRRPAPGPELLDAVVEAQELIGQLARGR